MTSSTIFFGLVVLRTNDESSITNSRLSDRHFCFEYHYCSKRLRDCQAHHYDDDDDDDDFLKVPACGTNLCCTPWFSSPPDAGLLAAFIAAAAAWSPFNRG
jgi:hypothetical protein